MTCVREITSQIQFNRLLEEESNCDPVTQEEASHKYYDSRPDLFSTELLLTASLILKKASSEAEFEKAEKEVAILRAKIEEEDFVELVRKESDDSQNDGHLREFGRGRMVAPFESRFCSRGR